MCSVWGCLSVCSGTWLRNILWSFHCQGYPYRTYQIRRVKTRKEFLGYYIVLEQKKGESSYSIQNVQRSVFCREIHVVIYNFRKVSFCLDLGVKSENKSSTPGKFGIDYTFICWLSQQMLALLWPFQQHI